MSTSPTWTVRAIKEALESCEQIRPGEMTVEMVHGAEPALRIEMNEYGDLPIFVSVAGEQVIVSVLLWPVDEQADRDRFNEFLLRSQKIVPLSNFGITRVDGRDYYELFGELSATSPLPTLIIELRTLADNAMRAAEDLRDDFASA